MRAAAVEFERERVAGAHRHRFDVSDEIYRRARRTPIAKPPLSIHDDIAWTLRVRGPMSSTTLARHYGCSRTKMRELIAATIARGLIREATHVGLRRRADGVLHGKTPITYEAVSRT